ncbi:DUF998 domain-containing protein [Humibacter ginsenosidimutans]|uniref:DUF998 domain-containing protein n=1 Tax=Humibacter ginsenosidimutans TaxID=2599293 RepID=A0A5B8M2R4_9MICO|nr:DUF998 domain-containing protein [Humibacter ginsenosidimutans]QDZ15078.1 DUF998 domain-containing protein [Humibacter ginsenosidimutans]
MSPSESGAAAQGVGAAAPNVRIDCTPEARVTKSLLGYGVIAGPFYVIASVIQGLLTSGFDFAHDSWSLLSTGSAGWIHVVVFVLTGLMVIAGAVGIHRHVSAGAARTAWAYLAGYGILLVGAGVFAPDVAGASFTWHGMVHLACGGLGFVAFAVWAFLVARRVGQTSRALAVCSVIAGVLLLVGFGFVASGAGSALATVVFTIAVVVSWAWLSVASVLFYREAAEAGRIEVPLD